MSNLVRARAREQWAEIEHSPTGLSGGVCGGCSLGRGGESAGQIAGGIRSNSRELDQSENARALSTQNAPGPPTKPAAAHSEQQGGGSRARLNSASGSCAPKCGGSESARLCVALTSELQLAKLVAQWSVPSSSLVAYDARVASVLANEFAASVARVGSEPAAAAGADPPHRPTVIDESRKQPVGRGDERPRACADRGDSSRIYGDAQHVHLMNLRHLIPGVQLVAPSRSLERLSRRNSLATMQPLGSTRFERGPSSASICSLAQCVSE